MRIEGVLQLVHNDIFGPMSITSLGKYVYCVSFIDEFSRNTWIHGYIVFLTFDLCFRQVTRDSSKGATVTIILAIVLFTIIKRVLFLLVVLLTLVQVTHDNPKEPIVKVAEGNRFDMKKTMYLQKATD
jgi:hypothetical protein